MKDIPKEVVFVLLAVYAVLLVMQSYVLLDYGATGRGTTATVSVCFGGKPQFIYPLGCADNVTVGKLYFCDLDITNDADNITFTDNTSLFQIGKTTGIITFSPDLTEVGMQNAEITIQNFCEQNSTTLSINVTRPVCGNGFVEIGETCDDGNVVSGDGCSSTCKIEIPTTTTTTIIKESGGGGVGDKSGGKPSSAQQAQQAGVAAIGITAPAALSSSAQKAGVAAIGITAPAALSVTSGNHLSVPVYITNNEKTDMEDVSISVSATNSVTKGAGQKATGHAIALFTGFASAQALAVTVEPSSIPLLAKGKSQKLTVSVVTKGSKEVEPGEYAVKLLIASKKPKRERTQIMYVTVTAPDKQIIKQKTRLLTNLELSYQLLAQHPECIVMKDLIDQAQAEVIDGKFEQGEAFAKSAIELCYYLTGITLKEAVREKPSAGAEVTSNIIVSLIVISLLLTLLIVYLWSYYKQSPTYSSSATFARINSLIQDVYKALDAGNVTEAKRSYAALRRIYTKLKKHEQTSVYKDIIVLYKEIEDAVKK